MIGVVLITHGGLGQALRDAMEHVVGVQPQFAAVGVGAEDDIPSVRAEIVRRIREVDTGDGTVLLTDMFGGTPSNLAVSMLARGGVEVISGVNLPMLVKLAKVRGEGSLGECVDCAEAAGRKYISTASHLPSACLGGSACASTLRPIGDVASTAPIVPPGPVLPARGAAGPAVRTGGG